MEVSDFVRGLLQKRGILTDEAIATFLHPDYDLHTHAPFLLQDMGKALQRLFAAIEKKERVAIYADFDCDGIPGAALLSDLFEKIGHSNFEIYIPHRDKEGYGFHKEAIDALSQHGVSLIITVDVGTVASEGVEHARTKGIDVIVTDHHEISSEMARPYALLNPKLGTYPFRDLCGTGVAFKLAQALLIEGRRRGIERFKEIPEGWEKWLLDLVAIATVADLVPLLGENRVLTHFGLRVLRRTPRAGLITLCSRLRLRRFEITEDDIAFSIAPRINAASRMDEPRLALRLLTTKDEKEAELLASSLEDLNARRKVAVASIVKEAKKSVRTRFTENEKVVVFGNPEWKPALLGLAANSIMEERGGLVCIWGRDAAGNLKGSCRSDGSLSVVEVFSSAKEHLVAYGGHERSGGFTVAHEKVHSLHETLSECARDLSLFTIEGRREDATLYLSDVSPILFSELSNLAPFGMGNPKPLFRICGAILTEVKRFGKERGHVEVLLECRNTGVRARSFDFFRAPEEFTYPAKAGSEAHLLGTIEKDTFRGGLAIRLHDVLPLPA